MPPAAAKRISGLTVAAKRQLDSRAYQQQVGHQASKWQRSGQDSVANQPVIGLRGWPPIASRSSSGGQPLQRLILYTLTPTAKF